KPNGKRIKEGRKWDDSVSREEAAALDYSSQNIEHLNGDHNHLNCGEFYLSKTEAASLERLRGTLSQGDLHEVAISSGEEDDAPIDELSNEIINDPNMVDKTSSKTMQESGRGLVFSLLRGLRVPIGANGRLLTREDIDPCLEQLRERLIQKNVAVEISQRLCASVCAKLVGTPLGTFERVTSRVKYGLTEACTRLLSSGRRVDVLRDAMEAKLANRPYVIVFCGVNGVGKSTNLAKEL
ncbi:unnamed protein product, partial [Protopolystoma xenopodis]